MGEEAGLSIKAIENLQGGKLTVNIWNFEKNKAAKPESLKVVK